MDPHKQTAQTLDTGDSPLLTRRESLAALGTVLTALAFPSQGNAEEHSPSTPPSPSESKERFSPEFAAIHDFCKRSVEARAKLQVADEVIQRSSPEQRTLWKETRTNLVSAFQLEELAVLEQIRKDFAGEVSEQELTSSIQSTSKDLGDFTTQLDELMTELQQGSEQAEPEPPQKEDSPTSITRPTFIFSGPFEGAIAKTGLYDEVARLLDKVAHVGIDALQQGLEQHQREGGSLTDLLRPNPNDWRAHLAQKEPLYPGQVLPEIALRNLLDGTARIMAMRQLGHNISAAPESSKPRNWETSLKELEDKLSSIEESYAGGYEDLRDNAKHLAANFQAGQPSFSVTIDDDKFKLAGTKLGLEYQKLKATWGLVEMRMKHLNDTTHEQQ